MKTLFLGDSYTIGESVDQTEGWPLQLVTELRLRGFPMAEPVIIAQTGWTTGDLIKAIKCQEIETGFDLVSLLIGVNNQFQNRDLEEYHFQFHQLMEKAIYLADNQPFRVMVLSIPDWGVTPFAEGRVRLRITEEIDRFNQINRQEAECGEVHYIDVTTISRQASNDPSLIAEDGLHPSSKMYQVWVKTILPEVLEILEN